MYDIKQISQSIKSYDELYDLISNFNFNISGLIEKDIMLSELYNMKEYFIKTEDFDKVIIVERLIKQNF